MQGSSQDDLRDTSIRKLLKEGGFSFGLKFEDIVHLQEVGVGGLWGSRVYCICSRNQRDEHGFVVDFPFLFIPESWTMGWCYPQLGRVFLHQLI